MAGPTALVTEALDIQFQRAIAKVGPTRLTAQRLFDSKSTRWLDVFLPWVGVLHAIRALQDKFRQLEHERDVAKGDPSAP